MVQVELEAGQLEEVGEQQLGLQTRRVHAVALQEFGAALDDFANGHAGSVGERAGGPKAFHGGPEELALALGPWPAQNPIRPCQTFSQSKTTS